MKDKVAPKRDITRIRPLRLEGAGDKTLPVRGQELISELYANMFLVAKKNSGKTTVISHLLKHTIDKRTTVCIFSSTVHIDKAWIAIQKMLKRKGISVFVFTSLVEDGVNLLEQFLDGVSNENTNPRSSEVLEEKKECINKEPDTKRLCHFPEEDTKTVEPEKKERLISYSTRVPKYWMILDDLDVASLRSPVIANMLKKNRHYQMRTSIVSQHVIHIKPDSYSQLDYLYLWAGFAEDYVRKVWEHISSHMDFNEFYTLYREATAEKYSFLNIDIRNQSYRVKFGKHLKI